MLLLNCHIDRLFLSFTAPKGAVFKTPEAGQEAAPKTSSGGSADSNAIDNFMNSLGDRLNKIETKASNRVLKLNVIDQARMQVLDNRALELKKASAAARIEAAKKVEALYRYYEKIFDNLSNRVGLYVQMEKLHHEIRKGLKDVQQDVAQNVFILKDIPSAVALATAQTSLDEAANRQTTLRKNIETLRLAKDSIPPSKPGDTANATRFMLTTLYDTSVQKEAATSRFLHAAQNYLQGYRVKAENASVVQGLAVNETDQKDPKKPTDPREAATAQEKFAAALRQIRGAEITYVQITADRERFRVDLNTPYQIDEAILGPAEAKAKKEYGIKEMPTVALEQASLVERLQPGQEMKLKVMSSDELTEVNVRKEREDEGAGWVLSDVKKRFSTVDELLLNATLLVAEKNSLHEKDRNQIPSSKKDFSPQQKSVPVTSSNKNQN